MLIISPGGREDRDGRHGRCRCKGLALERCRKHWDNLYTVSTEGPCRTEARGKAGNALRVGAQYVTSNVC